MLEVSQINRKLEATAAEYFEEVLEIWYVGGQPNSWKAAEYFIAAEYFEEVLEIVAGTVGKNIKHLTSSVEQGMTMEGNLDMRAWSKCVQECGGHFVKMQVANTLPISFQLWSNYTDEHEPWG